MISVVLTIIFITISTLLTLNLFTFSHDGFNTGITLYSSPGLVDTISITRGEVEPAEATYTLDPESQNGKESYAMRYSFDASSVATAAILEAQRQTDCWVHDFSNTLQTTKITHVGNPPLFLLIPQNSLLDVYCRMYFPTKYSFSGRTYEFNFGSQVSGRLAADERRYFPLLHKMEPLRLLN